MRDEVLISDLALTLQDLRQELHKSCKESKVPASVCPTENCVAVSVLTARVLKRLQEFFDK